MGGLIVGRAAGVDGHVDVTVGESAFFGAAAVGGVECWLAGGDGRGADQACPVVKGGGVSSVVVHGG